MPFQVLSFLHPHILATIKKYLLANHFSKAVKVWSGFTNYPSFMSQNPHIHSRDSRLTEVSIRDSRSQGCIASSFFLWCSWQFSRTERVLAVHAFSAMAKGHPQRAPPKSSVLFSKSQGKEKSDESSLEQIPQGSSTLILPDGLYVRVLPPQHILQLLLRATNKEKVYDSEPTQSLVLQKA